MGAVKDPKLAPQLPLLFQAMVLICRVFVSLSSQDIPEFFEDHLKDFMGPFDAFLKYNNKALDSKDDTPGVLEQLKTVLALCCVVLCCGCAVAVLWLCCGCAVAMLCYAVLWLCRRFGLFACWGDLLTCVVWLVGGV